MIRDYFLLLSRVDPVIAGLNEGEKCREKGFLTLAPDSDRNGRPFYEIPAQLVKTKAGWLEPSAHVIAEKFVRTSNPATGIQMPAGTRP
jgi:hypothetical protein